MDYLQEYILPHLQTSSLQTIQSFTSNIRTTYLDPYIIRPLSSLLVSSTPDLVSVLLLALILLISLKVLDYARRVIVFWVSLVLRLVFWGSVVGVVWYVYSFGWERAGRDVGWVWGVVEGFVQDFQRGGQDDVGSAGFGRYTSGYGYGYGQGSGSGYGRRTTTGRGW